MVRDPDSLDVQRLFAPGTRLRQAVDLIVRQDTGALVLFGSGPAIEDVCTGGFPLAATEMTPQRLAELAKMDGGIVVTTDFSRIDRANVHFLPDASIATAETGTRHRTAERLARQTGLPVLAISEGRATATVYANASRYELRSPTTLLAEANQGLNSLERFRRRLGDAEERLTRLEVDDIVMARDVVLLLQRAVLVRRLEQDLARTVVELGGEAHLIRLQAADLIEGVDELAEQVYADYARRRIRKARTITDRLAGIATEDLYDAPKVAASLRLTPLDAPLRPRGLRLLSRVPRLPESVRESLIRHFGDFQKLLRADVGDLDQVDGVGRARAQQLRNYFDRLTHLTGSWDLD